jgi:hypothetical protein
VTIWFRIDREGYYAQELENFTGKSTDCLREAVKFGDRIAHPARSLKLVVVASDERETDVDDLQHLENEDEVFNFKQLVIDYKIKEYNPILVKLPGRYNSFRLNRAY